MARKTQPHANTAAPRSKTSSSAGAGQSNQPAIRPIVRRESPSSESVTKRTLRRS